ncbi:MAG TPA: dihydrodipicolinate synthase family protein, partial [Niabella sp.]|nr:dihydrodipicolinate synthase family protein [Niabella sp.]
TGAAYEMQQQSDSAGSLYQAGRTLGESLWALKVLMNERGLCQPVVMPPLQPQSEEEIGKLKRSLLEINYQ